MHITQESSSFLISYLYICKALFTLLRRKPDQEAGGRGVRESQTLRKKKKRQRKILVPGTTQNRKKYRV